MRLTARPAVFGVALLIAIALHAAAIVPFLVTPAETARFAHRSLAVTIAAPNADERPQQAGFEGIADQQGAGDAQHLQRLKANLTDRATDTRPQPDNARGVTQPDQDDAAARLVHVAGDTQRRLGLGELTLNLAPHAQIAGQAQRDLLAELDLGAEQLMGLGEGSGQKVATLKSVRAGYLYRWRQHIQRQGLLSGASRQTGELKLTATLSYNGQLLGYTIERSSGQPQLDRKAIEILKAAAPFEPFPNEMMAQHAQIQITRIWQFNAQGPTLR